MAKKVTIYTIGEELGMSPGTVSKALNNHPSISAATRAKVVPLAEKYNFKPRLVSNKPVNICVLIQTCKGHPAGFGDFIAMVMGGVSEYCHEEDMEMSVYSACAEEMNNSDIVRELRRRTANGAIILCANSESKYIRQMNEQGFSYFCIAHRVENSPEKSLTFDYEDMGYKATKHLLSLGHRVIGIICDSMSNYHIVRRYEGYIKALKEAGINPDDRWIYNADPIPDSFRPAMQIGVDGVAALMARVADMTAVFAVDDNIAYGAMVKLQEEGISIPEKISVIGISDYTQSEFVYPRLTTIHVPYKVIGYEAARQVHRLCRGLDTGINDRTLDSLVHKLVVRNSTGPVPGA